MNWGDPKMKKMSETNLAALAKAEDSLCEAISKMSEGASKVMRPEDAFIDVALVDATHKFVSCAAEALETLHHLRQFRKEFAP